MWLEPVLFAFMSNIHGIDVKTIPHDVMPYIMAKQEQQQQQQQQQLQQL